jgi:hypothetical protein
MLANWSRQRFWDCVVSAQRDFFGPFLFLLSLKNLPFCKKILIFHAVPDFSAGQRFPFSGNAAMRAMPQVSPDGGT